MVRVPAGLLESHATHLDSVWISAFRLENLYRTLPGGVSADFVCMSPCVIRLVMLLEIDGC